MPLDVGAWGIDACYSCTQKCLGGPSGLAPVVFGPRALEQKVACRSFYFDLSLLEDYWLKRKYHHTMSSALVYALYEALSIVEEEGLDVRWSRHERNHRRLVSSLSEVGLSLLPPWLSRPPSRRGGVARCTRASWPESSVAIPTRGSVRAGFADRVVRVGGRSP